MTRERLDNWCEKGILVLVLAILVFGLYGGAGAGKKGGPGKKDVHADDLTGYQETPAISSSGTGSFRARIDEDGPVIFYELVYSGLVAPATVAHIHLGWRGSAGGISAFLCGGSGKPACPAGTTTEATVTGMITAADVIGPASQGIANGEIDELIAGIRAGVTYVNVHNVTYPSGEIRAQLNNDSQRQP